MSAGRHRADEVEPLELATAQLAYSLGLGGDLDALGGGLDPEAIGEGEDDGDDGTRVLVAVGGVADQLLVDLDLGELGAGEVA